jgi:hypothetical protein
MALSSARACACACARAGEPEEGCIVLSPLRAPTGDPFLVPKYGLLQSNAIQLDSQ